MLGMKEIQPRKEGLLEGKHALVTGGANGIGRAIVKDLVEEGAKVSFFDIDIKGTEALYRELEHKPVRGYVVDATNLDDIKQNIKHLGFGKIDILVNNCGRGSSFSLENPDESIWQKVFDTNFTSARYMTEAVLPSMVERGSGVIIYITSVHTAQGFPNEAAYDSSKHALVGLMRTVAVDFGEKGIRVNAVAPGAIYHAGRTALMKEQEVAEKSKLIPLKRLGEPEDIASVVSFLSSDKASYIHGAEIRVDGGLSVASKFA
jgi:NAD(P)-dependent dehydrogenase (short-subunit alcohol dehydrogenase family)